MPDHKPHPSDAAARTLIDSLAEGSFGRYDDGDQAALRRARFAALGPVTSLQYLRSDESGDVHRATFAHGRLLLTTQRNKAGEITHFELVSV